MTLNNLYKIMLLLTLAPKYAMEDEVILIHPEDEDTQRRRRTQEVLQQLGISQRDFSRRTGFSKSQWYAWFSTQRSSASRMPSLLQFNQICEAYNLSATWLLKGIGPRFLHHFAPEQLNQELVEFVSRLQELIEEVSGK